MKKLFLIGMFLVTVSCASAPPSLSQGCAGLQKVIDETYKFKPSKLNDAERTARSAKMDVVWSKVDADPNGMLPCLREAIDTRTDDTFFRFDAANLLFKHDKSADAKKMLIRSYADVDFADIDPAYWMPYIAKLGFEGFDTSAAAENWLRHTDPGYYLPQHAALKIDKEIGAVIAWGSMDEAYATPALAKIAAREDHPGREIAVRLLMQQVTAESFAELKKVNSNGLSPRTIADLKALLTKPVLLAKREGTPKVTRQQYLNAFQQLVDGKPDTFTALTADSPDGERDAIAVMKEEDIPLIRKVRRMMVVPATPHSPEWYDSFTKILMAMVWTPELAGPDAPPTKSVNPEEE